MPNVLIVYGTTDGHTAKVAARFGEMLRAEHVGAEVYHAADIPGEVRLSSYDGVVVAASVHASGHQRSVKKWVRGHADELNRLPGAFLSICLGVLEKDPGVQAEVRGTIQKFLDTTGWNPPVAVPVAGALPWSRYGWLKTWIMRRIVEKAGGDTDTSRDYEYTDWADLRRLAVMFADRVRPKAPNVIEEPATSA